MINYDLTKIRGLIFDFDGVLSLNTIPMDAEGQPLRTLNIKDGYAIQLAVKEGFELGIITGGITEVIRKRYEYLHVQHIYIGASHKMTELQDLMAKTGLRPDQLLYMGDDIPDYEVMRYVGLPVCPADAAEEIRAISTYVSPYNGGAGAARDVIEQVLKANGKWMTDKIAFGW